MRPMLDTYPKTIWLNPEPEQLWPCRQSISVIREIMEARMYPITIEGLERATRNLSKQVGDHCIRNTLLDRSAPNATVAP
jgi:uncharacterized protein with von Willebrand factor type A (vWA) domain